MPDGTSSGQAQASKSHQTLAFLPSHSIRTDHLKFRTHLPYSQLTLDLCPQVSQMPGTLPICRSFPICTTAQKMHPSGHSSTTPAPSVCCPRASISWMGVHMHPDSLEVFFNPSSQVFVFSSSEKKKSPIVVCPSPGITGVWYQEVSKHPKLLLHSSTQPWSFPKKNQLLNSNHSNQLTSGLEKNTQDELAMKYSTF